ncbi:anthranilate phosphoribosyltransferase [Secundilactobacillus oryzae JCM 18671]|uniref:Anthranilate phosphoribosyltransferase n=1 Tax=Secundilactobacillus oryzae JCM 18671 TaxID=1291743 RepID=A0A081BGD7_9LACO|nr:anthranilate phosphoribosyltransferase [Secundilactobacillus oryzae]GAK47105.1 anthranilate phosphoribosyltransferase [Secundilactobacillus oryzae JCM 18671]
MIEQAIKKVAEKQDLTFNEAQTVVDEIMGGQATNVPIASLLTGLAIKKETVEEIAGAASAMRQHALPVAIEKPVLEIVGTGGDHSNSFNISTTAALVVAAAGIPVAKHGNRAASSKSGAADVLEALGIKIDGAPETSASMLNTIDICFLCAQEYHQAMRYVAPVRKELGIRTLFNILGPLATPAHAENQLLGVYSESLLLPMAQVLTKLGVKNAMVVYGRDGLDEVSITDSTAVAELRSGELTTYDITPEQFGFKRAPHADIVGGTPTDNATITREVLSGNSGATRDIVLMNAGGAIHVARPELSLAAAIQLAAQTIDSGQATAKLEQFIERSQRAVVA